MKTKKALRTGISILTVLIGTQLFSQGNHGQSGAFLRYGVGSRALGMGRAFAAVANDASGIYWNPAGLMEMNRMELTSMYTNLFFDSQYYFLGVAIPRPVPNIKSKLGKFLLGPSTAVAAGWINLASDNYLQTSRTGEEVGQFGINESAYLVSWAKEWVSSWGMFRYGLTYKRVYQGFNGLKTAHNLNFTGDYKKWSGGLDMGFQFQPINMPILKVINLKYLLPLRFGITCQNLVQPAWKETSGHTDAFPRVLRWGVSYRWVLRDWIPGQWEAVQQFLGDSQVLFAVDKEYYDDIESGTYFGMEGLFPLSDGRLIFSPRAGFNNRTEGMALGAGMEIPFRDKVRLRIDYAYGFHPYLPEDSRFFMTFQWGGDLGASFFKKRIESQNLTPKERFQDLQRIIASYPNPHVAEAVEQITVHPLVDSATAKRYFDLTGGLGRAECLFVEAIDALRDGENNRALKKANDAINDYEDAYYNIQTLADFTSRNKLNYAEALIMAGRFHQSQQILIHDSLKVNIDSQDSLRYNYLAGVTLMGLKEYEKVYHYFRTVMNSYRLLPTGMQDSREVINMISLALLSSSEASCRLGEYEQAMGSLKYIFDTFHAPLSPQYPRYPVYEDFQVIDDARYLHGLCLLKTGEWEAGVNALMNTFRYYPDYEYGVEVRRVSQQLIDALRQSNEVALNELADYLLNEYYVKHNRTLNSE